MNDDGKRRVILQLTDQTAIVRFNNEKTQKLITSMVNATVSHEIRNPLNSIYCQSIVAKTLVQRVADLLASKMNHEDMRAELTDIKERLCYSQSINESSVQIAIFLSEDYLDLA